MARGWTFGKIVIVILLGLTVVLAGVGWYLYSKHLGPLIQEGRAQRVQGAEFGESADAQECLLKTFEIYAEGPGVKQGMVCRGFLDACLSKSSPAPGFCEGVPTKNEIVASAKWRLSVCGRAGHGDESCHMLLEPVQEYCDGVGAGAYDRGGADDGDADQGSEAGSGDDGASGTNEAGEAAGEGETDEANETDAAVTDGEGS